MRVLVLEWWFYEWCFKTSLHISVFARCVSMNMYCWHWGKRKLIKEVSQQLFLTLECPPLFFSHVLS